MRSRTKKDFPAPLRPQDVLVVLKLCAVGDARDYGVRELATSVGLSGSETYNSIGRCRHAGLVYEKDRAIKLIPRRILSFLVHGVPVVFFAERGALGRGMPTGMSASPLVERRTESAEVDIPLVWPTPDGKIRGETLQPIYATAPAAAALDRGLYELLALLDGVRAGATKDKKLAAEILEKRLVPEKEIS